MLRNIKQAYKDNPEYYRREVNRINLRALFLIPLIGIPASIFNIVAHAIMMRQASQRNGYLLLAYYILIFVLTRTMRNLKIRRGTLVIYLVQVPIYIMTILSGTLLDPEHQALTFLLYILALPPFILDRPHRVIGFASFWMCLLLFLSFICKERAVFRADLMHVIQVYFLLIGTMLIILDSRYKLLKVHLETIRFSESDEMTGLLNRKYFIRNAEQRIQMAEDAEDLFILSFDIKNMRSYNEVCGYTEGNYLLMKIADRLKEEFPSGLLSRFDEDHFYILTAREEMEKGLHSLTENPMRGSTGKEVIMKIGVYAYFNSDSVAVACDRAALACKNAVGPKNVRWYDEQLLEDYEFKEYLLDHFHEAMQNEELVIYYQPVVRMYSGEMCSEEALVRWKDKERGMISPGKFIPLLEENNLSWELDLYVIRQVMKEFDKKRAAGLAETPVSVNLSRMDFLGHDMPALISGILDEYHVSHDRIIIEITESIFAMGNDLLKDALNDFHARGFRVWMDDFGSGYSSLNLLAQFHFDVVKFDIRFVRNLEDGSSGQLILEKMLELIEALGIGTLIEGVESKEQLELLRKIDGQRIQGYLYSRPRPLSQLIWFSQNGGNLTYENPEKEHYYDEISMVSLRKPLQYENIKFDSDMEMEFPAEVIEISEDQKVTILRKNEHQAEFSRLFGTADANGEIRFLPDADSEIAELFRKASESMVWERLKIGCGAEQNAESTVFVHYISRDPLTGSVAYLAVIV